MSTTTGIHSPCALVIDDSRAVRLLLRGILERLGFTVEEAADGQEGLARLRAGCGARLVLVDWDMPIMDGYRFVRELRGAPEFAGLRVVMVTRQTSLDHVRSALAAGADEYVMKPFDQAVISDKLALLGFGSPA